MSNYKLIKRITKIRAANNVAWMAILALAFEAKPKEAKKIMRKITKNDREVSKCAAKLG